MRTRFGNLRPSVFTAARPRVGRPARWGGLLAAVLALAVAGLAPARALAAYTVIGFDDRSNGDRVTTQYDSPQGIEFGTNGTSPPEAWTAGGVAASPPNVARLDRCPLDNPGCEFPPQYTDATFVDGHTRQSVSVNVGLLGVSGTATVMLTAYDSGNNVVGQDSATVTAGSPFNTDLTVNATQPDIAYFEVGNKFHTAPGAIGIDNVAFDNPTAGPPDFLLGAAQSVKVLAGSSAQTPISINRLNGSSGNIALALSGLPAGVGASITPNPASGASAMLTLTADATAQAGYTTSTLTGTPADAGAGPGPHSRSMTIEVERAFTLSVPSGTTANLSDCHPQVPVSVIRDFDFPGPVDLAVSGLPSGVSASFSPPQATFPSGVAEQTVTLTLTAPPDGLNRGPATVTVSGSSGGWPSSSATFKVQGACPLPFDARAQSIQIWIVVLELSTKPPGGDGVAGGVERDRRVAHVRAGRGLDRLRGLPVHSARPISAHDRRDWPVVLSCHTVVSSPRWSDAICGPIESCDVLDSTPGKQTPEPDDLEYVDVSISGWLPVAA